MATRWWCPTTRFTSARRSGSHGLWGFGFWVNFRGFRFRYCLRRLIGVGFGGPGARFQSLRDCGPRYHLLCAITYYVQKRRTMGHGEEFRVPTLHSSEASRLSEPSARTLRTLKPSIFPRPLRPNRQSLRAQRLRAPEPQSRTHPSPLTKKTKKNPTSSTLNPKPKAL